MAGDKFTWLSSKQYPRRGPVLIQGNEYSVSDFNPNAVAVWVKQGDAAYVYATKSKSKKSESSIKEV